MFKKGDPNINRNGRPKGRKNRLTKILEGFGQAEIVNNKGERVRMRAALAEKLWEMAMKGNLKAIEYIYDRIDGKPKQSIDMDLNTNDDSFVKALEELKDDNQETIENNQTLDQ